MSCSDTNKVTYADQLPTISALANSNKILVIVGRKYYVTTLGQLANFIQFSGGEINVNTDDTNTIALSGVGSDTDPLTANLKISAEDNNIITLKTDGIYVPAPSNVLSSGTISFNGDDNTAIFNIPHNLSSQPTFFMVQGITIDASFIGYVESTNNNIIVHLNSIPPVGINNIKFNWIAR